MTSISIVTPCLNDRRYLPAAMRSVLGQAYPDLEYIVVDGGSTDGCVEILSELEDRRVLWWSEPDGGQYAAINKGFARSNGEIMGWLNSDDMYCPWALRTVASIFEDCPEVEWLTTTTQMNWTGDGGAASPSFVRGYTRRWFFLGEHIGLGRRFRGVIQQESTFWRRSLWERAGSRLDERYELAGDFELWARFWKLASLYTTAAPLGGFRFRPGQRSGNFAGYLDEARMALEVGSVHPRPTVVRTAVPAASGRIAALARVWLRDSFVHRVDRDPGDGRWRASRRRFLS